MKFWTLVVLAQMVACLSKAGGPPLELFCEPFNAQGIHITWEATNHLPSSVAIFKVVPHKFSSSTVSNLLWIAELSERQKRRPIQEGVFAEKEVLCFGDAKANRQLTIVPSQGFVVLTKEGVIAGPKEPSINVPKNREAIELTSSLLPKLGIEKSEIVHGADGKIRPLSWAEGTDIHKDKVSGRVVTNVTDRTISLNRKIDGIPVWGTAGVEARYGGLGRLANLTLTWRNIQPSNKCAVPSAADFVNRIKAGQTLIRQGERVSGSNLVIKKALLYYWENHGSDPQRYIFPFAVLEAQTDNQQQPTQQIFVPFAGK